MAHQTGEYFCKVAVAAVLSLLAYTIAPGWAGPPVPVAEWEGVHLGGPCFEAPALGPCDVGTWYWLRSPEQEARRVAALYNRYCVRCHGHDGRGVCDIPDVPDFTCASWQVSRSDAQLTRLTLEGRGAVMPAFRGTLSLEEAAALARYLRRFAQPVVEEVAPPRLLPDVQTDSESTAATMHRSAS
jgi:hypothetical protein